MSSDNNKDSFASLFEGSAGAQRGKPRPKVGDRLKVAVIAISKDSVFVEIDERLEGFFDRSEVASDELPFDVGATITVLVEDTRGDQVRVTPLFVKPTPLSSAVETEDGVSVAIPVTRSTPLLVEGATVRGTVTSVERYGVFVQIDGTTGRAGRGLVPVSETLAPRGADLKKHYPAGSVVESKILAIQEDGKIRLSMKAAVADAERADFEKFAGGGGGGAKNDKVEKANPRGFGTFADLLQASAKPKAKK